VELLAIKETLEENTEFAENTDCSETLQMCIDYYKTIGYHLPWVQYYAKLNGIIVGNAAFKGAPKNGKVEIAFGTFEKYRQKGIGTEICKCLVQLTLKTDSSVVVTARTLPKTNNSTRILAKNGFVLLGTVIDKDDGEVWEWEYQKPNK
jgi:ribosomal-protein-alanine N-acetyltransferase